jgi:5-methylcytosine-specific restriction endonuclease McrA
VIRRSAPLQRKPMRKKPVARDWEDAKVKRGPCSVCGSSEYAQLHHIVGREFDKKVSSTRRWVDPDSVVSLCKLCHDLVHSHKLSLVGYLSFRELRCAVRICRKKGLNARLRLGGKR